MAKKKNNPSGNLPLSKQTAGGVTGAVVGSAIAGPLGAIVGGVAGALMGNRSAQGKTLVPSSTVKAAKEAVTSLRSKATRSRRASKVSAFGADASKKPSSRRVLENEPVSKKGISGKAAQKALQERPTSHKAKKSVATKHEKRKARA